jgi:drug/metabolite transporter (DMT)-like permease
MCPDELPASMIAAIALKEPFTLIEASCGGAGIIGVVFITRPPFVFGSDAVPHPGRALGFFVMAVNTVGAAVIFVIMRFIGNRADALFSVSYFGWIASSMMACVMLAVPHQRASLASMDAIAVAYLAAVRNQSRTKISLLIVAEQLSFTGFLATYLQNLSIQMAKVGRVTLYLYVQVRSLF